MISFENDYAEGAHPKILQRLMETNLVQQVGYGNDEYCQSAKEKIRAACQCPDADIFFISGGTQSNSLVIRAMLQPFQGVVSVTTGHINGHEAGAIEYTGTKATPDEPTYLVKEVNGIKIGIANFTYETQGSDPNRKYLNGGAIASEANPYINTFSYPRLEKFYKEGRNNRPH